MPGQCDAVGLRPRGLCGVKDLANALLDGRGVVPPKGSTCRAVVKPQRREPRVQLREGPAEALGYASVKSSGVRPRLASRAAAERRWLIGEHRNDGAAEMLTQRRGVRVV